MSLLRQKLSERLVAVKNETAMLTTFNEVDMSAVIDLRNRYKKSFEEKYGVKLGFMSFFTLAATRALMSFPQVNSQMDGGDVVTFQYTDIGIAVQTPKGLMVPVIRNTNLMSLAQIELAIAATAQKARENRITLDELQGGTFSITNGGVFGSLLSTPILNPPQPAILGMHNIVERPVAQAGQVVIRPMMYVALSYDHRVIDGKDSVGFLKMIKDLIETPLNLLDPGGNAERGLLGL
jgi:2-oxoglutarate dehydrogenase E2 component (dihydrolipoamide succinyltransferase)